MLVQCCCSSPLFKSSTQSCIAFGLFTDRQYGHSEDRRSSGVPTSSQVCTEGNEVNLLSFQGLYMPKSKSHDYLNSMGEKVLASFPVQATIHFYNDDSDSEEDEEEIQEERGLPRL
ncbi:DSCR6 protein, partial [Polyodon spathula]|nr:DSCR6 protein [Polyodon spathula]